MRGTFVDKCLRIQQSPCLTNVNLYARIIIVTAILVLGLLFKQGFHPSIGQRMPFGPPSLSGIESSEQFHLPLQIPSWALCTHASCSFSNLSYDPSSMDQTVLHRSQSGEDKILYEMIFYGMKGGFFLEMGALDGVNKSNTFWFAKAANWRGLLIEPSPDSFERLVDNRKESICVKAAICSQLRRVHYVIGKRIAVRGIYEFMAPAYLKQWHPNVTSPEGLPEVPCLPLATILSWLRIKQIDLWSLDVEGAELLVLEGFDFKRVRVNAIVVEADCKNDARNPAIEALLVEQGFVKIHHQKCRNAYFVHKLYQPYISTAKHALVKPL